MLDMMRRLVTVLILVSAMAASCAKKVEIPAGIEEACMERVRQEVVDPELMSNIAPPKISRVEDDIWHATATFQSTLPGGEEKIGGTYSCRVEPMGSGWRVTELTIEPAKLKRRQ